MEDNKERDSGIKAERKRQDSLNKTADSFRRWITNVDEYKEEFRNSDKTSVEFQDFLVKKMDSVKIDTPVESRTDDNVIGLTDKEIQTYSLIRMLNAQTSGDWSKAGFELEVSRAMELASPESGQPKGSYVPFSVLSRADAAASNSTTAAGVVPTNFMGDDYIDILRANSVAMELGATVLPNVSGNLTIPKGTNGATFAWTTEGAATTGTQYSAGTVSMSPHEIAGNIGYTRTMAKQTSNPFIEDIIRNDLNKGIGAFLDKEIIVGTDASSYGIVSAVTATSSSSALTWSSTVALETAVATADAMGINMAYACNPTVAGLAKTNVKDSSGAGGYIMAPDGTINGYKTGVSTNVGANLIFGDWSNVLVPMWGGVDIQVDPFTSANAGLTYLRLWLTADIAFRHVEGFAYQGSSISV